MEQQKQFTLDGVDYTMTPANAMRAWGTLKNALKLAQGIRFTGDNQQLGGEILTTILANLGDPSVKALEDIVLSHTTCVANGQAYRLSDNPDRHFNQYRQHLIPVLVKGVQYQFADFFNVGGELLNFMPKLSGQKA